MSIARERVCLPISHTELMAKQAVADKNSPPPIPLPSRITVEMRDLA